MSLDVGELVARLRLDSAAFDTGLSRARGSMQSTATSAGQMETKVQAAAAAQEAASKRAQLAEERLDAARRRGNSSSQEMMRLEASAAASRASMLRSTTSLAQAQQALADSQSSVQDSMGDSTDALGDAKDAADKARDALEQIGIGFSIAGVVEGLRQAVMAASDLAESTNGVDVMFGSASQRVQDWAASAAQSMGQSNVEARNGAVTMALYGKQANMTGDNLANFSMKMTQLASDMASFRNTTPEEAVEALGAAFRGESDPIEAYGVLLNETTLKNQAMADGLISNTSDALDPAIRVQAVYNSVLQQTSMMQGDFARTSDSLANRLRVLKADFTNGAAALGEKFMPIANSVVDLLSGPGMTAFAGAGAALGVLASVVTTLTSAFGSLPGPLQTALLGIVALRLATRLFGAQAASMVAPVRTAFSGMSQQISNIQRAATLTGNSMGLLRATMVAMGNAAMNSSSLTQRMGAAFYTARAGAASFGNVAGVAAAGMVGIRGAATGLMGALGGPWGLAITGAIAALSLWISKKQQDKAASQEAAQQTAAWADQLSQSGGKITRAMRTEVFKTADDDTKKLAVSGKSLADTLQDIGFSSEDTVSAILRQGDAYERVSSKLREMAEWQKKNPGKEAPWSQEDRAAASEALEMLDGYAEQADQAKTKAQQMAEANGDMSVSFDRSTSAVGAMTQGMADFEESTDGAASKVDKLAKALDQLNGDQQTQEEALQNWNDSIRDLVDTYADFDAGLVGVDGRINTTTEAGSKMQDAIQDQASAFNQTAAAAYEYAQSQNMGVAQSLDYVRAKLVAQRQQFLDTATAAGIPIEMARKMADAYGLIPEQVVTELNVHGTENAISGLQKLGLAATSLPPGNLKIIENTPAVRARLDELRVKYSVIDGKVVIDSNSPEVIAAMEKLGVSVTSLPNGYVQLNDNSPAVMDKLRSLGIQVQTLPNGKIVISPEDAAFWEAVRKAQEPGERIIHIRTVEEQTAYGNNVIQEWREAAQNANGSIRQRANGALDTPQIQNGSGAGQFAVTPFGPVRWAEGETDWEAFIPGAPSKRGQALPILGEVARRFGFMLAPMRTMADGGLTEVHKLAGYMQGLGTGSYVLGGWGQGWNTDCSGGQSIAQEGAHGNMNPGTGERAGTAAFASYLPGHGYTIGQAPVGVGAHEVGWSSEHAAGTFYGKSGASVNFEMGGGMDATSNADGKWGGTVGSRHSQFTNQAYIILPDTYGDSTTQASSTPAPDVVLSGSSSRDDVARKIIQEGRKRGYTDAQIADILGMAIQENNLQTDNVFQQMDPNVYPGRDDPNTNITGFYDALDEKKKSSGWSSTMDENLFWVQQAPSADTAASAVANGRAGYMDEINQHDEEAAELMSRLGPTVVGTVNVNSGSAGEFPSGDGATTNNSGSDDSTSTEPPEDPTLYEFTIKNPFEPFWWKGEKEYRQHIIDENEKQKAWNEYLANGGTGTASTESETKLAAAKRTVQEAEAALKVAQKAKDELTESSTDAQRTAAENAVAKATNDVAKAREALAAAEQKMGTAGQKPTTITAPSMLKFRAGGTVPGVGNTDSEIIAAMPGEEIIRKAIAEKPGVRSFLKRLNSGQLQAFSDGGTVGFGGYSDDNSDAMKPKNWYDWAGLAVGAGFAAYNTIDPYIQMGMSGQVDLGNATPKFSTNTTDTSYISGLVSDVGGQISQQLQELIWAVKEGKDIRISIQSDNKPQGFGEPAMAAMKQGL